MHKTIQFCRAARNDQQRVWCLSLSIFRFLFSAIPIKKGGPLAPLARDLRDEVAFVVGSLDNPPPQLPMFKLCNYRWSAYVELLNTP